MIRVVVLDFDGVVIESNDAKTEAFRDVFSAYPDHLDAMMRYHAEHVSVTRFAKFDHLLERLGRRGDDRLRATLADEFSRRAEDRIAAVPMVPGAAEFLEEFQSRVALYLASVTPQADLDRTLARRGLARFFRAAYGCPPWTKPGAVLDVLRRENCPPSSAVLVGDSPGDQKAAAESGVAFIGRDSGLRFTDGADVVFPDMFGVAQHLRDRIS